MNPRGQLDKLQEAVTRRLASASELAVAEIHAESANFLKEQISKSSGVKISVAIPMPISASKYAAGPVFSKVAVKVVVEREHSIAMHSPSLASLAESVTKILHKWVAPLESCYGKLVLDAQNPWQRVQLKSLNSDAISVNFTVQSVLS